MLTKELAASMVALVTFVALAIGGVPFARLNRATVAVVGSAVLLAFGVVTLAQAGATVDPSTILLLFSMMVINAVLELAGFFNWAGQMIIERAGSPHVLLILVVVTGGVLSALFLNDPVVLMLTPLVCGVTLRLKRNPVPYLIALATASNVGSTATITGNPQNILIGTSSGIPYLAFLAHLAPVAAVGLLTVVVVIRFLYPDEFRAHGLELRDDPPEPISAPAQPRPAMSMASAASMVKGLAYSGVLPLSLVTTVLSNLISNVPAVLLFRPLIPQFPNPAQAWLTLSASATLAGNLTLVGSVANLIVAEQALKVGVRLTFKEFLRAGVLITALTLLVAVVWLSLVN